MSHVRLSGPPLLPALGGGGGWGLLTGRVGGQGFEPVTQLLVLELNAVEVFFFFVGDSAAFHQRRRQQQQQQLLLLIGLT